jgi:squalene-hopene/tetraprenyl-beta-curcumene cyclase
MHTAWTLVAMATLAAPALGIDEAHRQRAAQMIDKAATYLLAQQHESGGWNVPEDPNAPLFPAITGLVVNALALHPGGDGMHMTEIQEAADRGINFILAHRQPDGGIYAEMLPSYNTAICVSALVRYRDARPDAEAAIGPAVAFLRGLQWGEDAGVANPDGSESVASQTVAVVGPDHPFYGGIGYGRHGRPDNSNLNLVTQAFHDAGVDRDDPAFQRALVFLRRTQMHEAVNDAEYAEGSRQGGFIYATAETGEDPGVGQSQAGLIEETLDDGTTISRLRAYGSMTYAAFKTMIYAGLSKEDERVRLAIEWIEKNYTVQENPGIGTAGLYYFYLTFARALEAAEIEKLEVRVGDDTPGTSSRRVQPDGTVVIYSGGGFITIERDWANDLIDQLATLQNDDGSFRSVDDRWMENDPVLITAYAMLALEYAAGLAD